MWRANVIERIEAGRVVVTIPALFRGDPVGPMQSAVDCQVGDTVIVADLVPAAKIRDWWVVGYESEVGRWGNPYPHTHPIGQVDGLVNELGLKAYLTDLAPYVTETKLSTTLAPYVTETKLSTTLTGYATTSDLSTGLSGKANVPGAWTACSVSTYLTPDTTASPTLAVRNTPLGMQIRGRYRTTSVVPLDAVTFTLPVGFAPPEPILFSTPAMGPGTAYASLTYGMEFQANRTVTARQEYASGARMSFNGILTL